MSSGLLARHCRVADADDASWSVPSRPISAHLRALADGRILTDPHGALYGETAQAFALDAPRAVAFGMLWNSLDLSGYTVYQSRLALAGDMDINNPDQWVAYLGTMLDPTSAGDVEAILRVRADLIRSSGGMLPDDWVDELHGWLTRTDQDGAHDRLDQLAPEISRVDGWLVDAGLQAPGSYVGTVSGYQAAYAVSVIRLGARAGYADYAAATQALLACRDLIGATCASWQEHAASLAAGSALMTSPEYARDRFDAVIGGIATCFIDPESPWQVLGFPFPDITIDDLEEQTWDF